MSKVIVDVSDEQIIEAIIEQSEDEVVEILKRVDLEFGSWSLTEKIFEHFMKEMKRNFDTEKDFLIYLDQFKED